MAAKKTAPKPTPKMVATTAEAHKRLKTLAQQYHLTIGELVETMAIYFSKSGIDPRYVESAKSPEDATRVAIGKLEKKVTSVNTSAWAAVQEVKKETARLNVAVDAILKLGERLAVMGQTPIEQPDTMEVMPELEPEPNQEPEPTPFPSVSRMFDHATMYKIKSGEWMAYVTKDGKESKRQFVPNSLITPMVAVQLTREGGDNTDLVHYLVNSMTWEF